LHEKIYLSVYLSVYLSLSLNGQVLNSQEIGTGTNIQRNASFNVEEIKVRWKKAALENCTGAPCVPLCGELTVRDIDNNYYKTVQIGTQCWTKENLKVTRYNDGTLIPDETTSTGPNWASLTTGARTEYVGLILTAAGMAPVTNYVGTYGYLYNWHAVADSRKLCPTGWHVPSDSEWSILLKVLDSNANNTSFTESSTAGGKMKDNIDWNRRPALGGLIPADPQATNSSGFSALPGGERNITGSPGSYSSGFALIGNSAFFQSSTPDNSNALAAFNREVIQSSSDVYRFPKNKGTGQSVRCIKD
jgi:uncharacterized protein (TIGR02145 family)